MSQAIMLNIDKKITVPDFHGKVAELRLMLLYANICTRRSYSIVWRVSTSDSIDFLYTASMC